MNRILGGVVTAVGAGALLLAGGAVVAAHGHALKQAKMGTATLVVGEQDGSPDFTENFNPFNVNSLHGWWYMYEPLYELDTLTGQQIPWLATGYKWVTNKELQFTLRTGVKWSNGQPFTAQDVLFTFNLLKQYPALDTNGIWQQISSVSASGNTVTFHFKTVDIPFWQFIAAQTPIVYPPQFEHVNPVKFTDTDPIVTGPYVVGSFTPAAYTLKANPNYWQKNLISVPAIQEIALSNNTTADLYLSEGKFDWAVLFEPGIQQAFVAKNPSKFHYWFPLASPVNLYLNLTKPPFNNVKFREAMAYAINKNLIYKKGEYGYEPPANQSLLPPTLYQGWLDKSLAANYAYAYNPKKALSLLESIGYKKQGGKLVGSNGQQVSFTLEVPTGWTDWIQDIEIIKQELGNLGINVILETPSQTTDYNDVETGTFQAALVYGWTESNPYFIWYNILDSKASAKVGSVANFNSNTERWINTETDSLLSQFSQTTSAAVQHRIADQLQKILFTQLPVVSLVSAASWNEYTTVHYVGWPTPQNPYANPEDSYPDALLVLTHLRPAA